MTVTADARSAARGGLALAVLQTLGRVAGVLFVVVATRSLAPAEFGRYSIVAALLVVGGLLADFGTTPVLTRHIARDPDDADATLAGTLPACFGLGIASAVFVVGLAAAIYPGRTVTDVAIGAISLPLAAMATSVGAALDGRGLLAQRAVVTFLSIATVTLGAAVPLAAGADARAAVWALVAGPLVGLATSTVLARRNGVWRSAPRFDRARSLALLRQALPYAALGAISAVSMRFDVLLLSLVGTAASTAAYDLALRVGEALLFVGTVITAPSLFLLSRRLGTGDVDGAERAFGEAARLTYVVGLPLSVGLAVFHDDAARLVFGADYAASAVPLAILGGGIAVTLLAMLQGALILAGDHVGAGLRTAALVTALMVLFDIALVLPFGATGAAVASVAGGIVTVAAFGRFHRRTTGIRTPAPSPGLLTASVLCGGTAWVLSGTSTALAVVAAAAVYVTAAVATGAVTTDDFRRLRTVVLREPSLRR